MKVKEGVNIVGLQPAMVIAILAADKIWQRHAKDLVITSALDGKHSTASLHYIGHALDFRTRYFVDKEECEKVADELRAALGWQFDVVLEADHIHCEFQPKRL